MVDVAGARVVAVLTRAPSGGGKTRLFAALARQPDPGLAEALLLDTIDGTGVPGVTRIVAVDPADACGEVRALVPPGVRVIGQPGGDLGDRMRLVMEALLRRGARAVALIGSDLPELDPDVLADAFARLDAHPDQVVLGPATDGGYYLIAATRVPDVFGGIEWGSATVLAGTLAAAGRAGLEVHLLPSASDIDSPGDLRRLMEARTGRARRTIAWAREALPPRAPGAANG